MTIRVTNHLDDLAADMKRIKAECRGDMRGVVLDGIRAGNVEAQAHARRHNPPGSHSWKYPGRFSAEMHQGRGLFGNVISGEYGPRKGGQGSLAPILENGSRKGNKPQENLAKSADFIGPIFGVEVGRLPDKWFWPA